VVSLSFRVTLARRRGGGVKEARPPCTSPRGREKGREKGSCYLVCRGKQTAFFKSEVQKKGGEGVLVSHSHLTLVDKGVQCLDAVRGKGMGHGGSQQGERGGP